MNTHLNANLLKPDADELERLVLEEVHKRRLGQGALSALVLPVGQGELALKLANLGCEVTGCDDPAYEQDFLGRALAAGKQGAMNFVPGALDSLNALPSHPYDIIYLRRGLCCLPYTAARQVLRNLIPKLKIGGKLYVSVLGMHSELGEKYPGTETVVEERFCRLDPDMAIKYGIEQPVCLYSERNLFLLLMEVGVSLLRTFTTTHGSIKGIAVRV